jgi:hypothetical protein
MTKVISIKKCPNCGEEFEIKDKFKLSQKYCSVKCRTEFSKKSTYEKNEKNPDYLTEDYTYEHGDLFAVLGYMMIDKVFMLWCFKNGINVEMFYKSEVAQMIFHNINELRQEREPVDILTVTHRLIYMKDNNFQIYNSTVKVPYFITHIADYADKKGKSVPYAIMKKHFAIDNKKPEDLSNISSDTKEIYWKTFLEHPETKKAQEEVFLPTTGAYQRQFYAGYMRAMQVLEQYEKKEEENENPFDFKIETILKPEYVSEFKKNSSSFDSEPPF